MTNFKEFLAAQNQCQSSLESQPKSQKMKRSQKLQQVRERIVASGLPLLNQEEIEQEKAERRGGYQGNQIQSSPHQLSVIKNYRSNSSC